jgi:lysophospholipase
MIGTAESAVNFWIIENESDGVLAPFPKRSISSPKKSAPVSQRDLSLFPNATLNGLLEAFNATFGLSAAEISHAVWPNPWASTSTGTPRDLSIVDSSEAGQVLPLWSQIQPERSSSFIIAWDDNPDAEPYGWLNGTSLHNTYIAAKSAGLPFPIVPPPRTMLNKNFTTRPTFFGCDAVLTTTGDSRSPIVLYMANAPYSAYSNYTWTDSVFSNSQMYEIFDNSFNALTQGNGTLDAEWPECLACAVIERSLEKVGMKTTKQCERCFEKYCWDGTLDERDAGVLDPGLALAPGVSFAEWNATSWI